MKNGLVGILLVGMTLLSVGNRGCLAADSDIPTVLLEGAGDSELAPHGQGNVYAPDVLHDGAVYRMWYGGQGKDGHDRISYAESVDGKSWTRMGVVLKDDQANHVNDPSVVKVGSKFYMYFTRTERDVVDRIDVAVSDDGKVWESHGAAITPGAAQAWDGLSAGRPSVIVEDGLFKMWYDGRKDFPPGAPVKGVPISPTSHRSVGYATSTDGITWTKYQGNPVFEYDAGAIDVKRVGKTLLMLRESHEGTRFAVSQDGIHWKDGGSFVNKSTSPWDAHGHVTPFLLLDPQMQIHRLFVGAASAATWDRNRVAVLEISNDRLNKPVRINNR